MQKLKNSFKGRITKKMLIKKVFNQIITSDCKNNREFRLYQKLQKEFPESIIKILKGDSGSSWGTGNYLISVQTEDKAPDWVVERLEVFLNERENRLMRLRRGEDYKIELSGSGFIKNIHYCDFIIKCVK